MVNLPIQLLPNGKQQFLDSDGKPLAGGQVWFYIPGTTALTTTWQDSQASEPNANPILLDGAGECVVWGQGQYRQVVRDQFGDLVWDQVVGVGAMALEGAVTLDRDVVFRFDNAGTAIAPGVLGDLYTTFPCTIVGWALQGDQAGSLVVDIWADEYVGDTPPVVGNSICGTAKPAIPATHSSWRGGDQNTTNPLTGWGTNLAAETWWRFNCVSCGSITRFTLTIKVLVTYPVALAQ